MLFSDPANIGEVKQKDHKFKAYLGILVRPVFWSSLYLLFLASTTCFVIIYFYYMGILPLCMSIYHMDARYPERPEYSIKSPGTKVTKHFEVSDRSRELIVIWSSGGVASAFNHWTISPDPKCFTSLSWAVFVFWTPSIQATMGNVWKLLSAAGHSSFSIQVATSFLWGLRVYVIKKEP